MPKKKTEDTQPLPAQFPEPEASFDSAREQPADVENTPKPKRRIGRWILLGILIVIVAVALSAGLAYSSGINARKDAESQVRITKAAEHYQYGLQMLEEKKYDLATVQFTYVIQLDPNFPGVIEKLTEAQMKAIEARQPTAAPTLMITATPDTRGVDELFAHAQASISDQDWKQAFQDLESLRNEDISYRMVEVDGMYYIVLRNLGIQQIFGNAEKGIGGGQLEEGIYSLHLASNFAPIDKDAVTAREWAKRYINASSNWGISWQDVIDQFQVIYQAYPYMTDYNGKTAFSRYAMALAYYGQRLFDSGDYCTAVARFQDANAVFQQFNRTPPDDIGDLMQKIAEASNKCNGPAPTKEPVLQETTVVPTAVLPTEPPPTETPTETPTP